VNLNTATTEELDTLPGVGPATAEAIIAHREANGPFTSVDQLLDVRGIGDAKLADLRDLVTV
jgi:competence protein ComEA